MKNVLITGSNRGIGRAISERFLKDPEYFVFGTLRSGTHPISHERFKAMYLNLSSLESISDFHEKMIDKEIHLLINNAGVLMETGTEEIVEMDVLKETFAVNLFGTIELTESLLAQLIPGSKIINITSTWSYIENEDFDQRFPAYRMSKAALNMYSKTLEKRVEEKLISVELFDPGWVKTNMGGLDAPKHPELVAEEIFEKVDF